MPTIHAMKDRVVLRFPPPITKLRGVEIPENWQMRPELGELVDCGEGLSEETRRLAIDIKEHAALGHRFLVPMATGTHYWRKEMGPEYEFLKDVRSYRISEIAVYVIPDAPQEGGTDAED
jgi:hypothetical protein